MTGITDEMVERGARAIWRLSTYHGYNEETLEREFERMANIWRNQVRAALLAALGDTHVVVPREPTEAMIDDGNGYGDWDAESIYKRMIATAVMSSEGRKDG